MREGADFAQQRKVLHVSRADLQHIRVARDPLDIARIEHFGNDAQAVPIAGIAQHLEPLFAEPLKRIRRGTWFVRAAAQDVGSCGGHRRRGRFELFARFDSARAGANGDLVASKSRAVPQTHDRSLAARIAPH